MDNTYFLSTPAGYATPSQITQMNEYAKYLGQDAQQKTITHPLQGVSNMVNALVGGWLSNQAATQERAARQYDTRNYPTAPAYPGQAPPITPKTSPSM